MSPERPTYLALDQGGHGSRAMIFDEGGSLVAGADVPVSTTVADGLRVEHDAGELASSVRSALDDVLAQVGTGADHLVAAGLATQRSSIACWDRVSGAPLSPVISWQDRRAAGWLRQFDGERERVRERTGLFLSPHYGVSKMRWCLDHLPAVQAARADGRLVMAPLASQLLFFLLPSRPLLVDPANASRTLLWSQESLDWDDGLLELFGLDRTVLPTNVPTEYPFGDLKLGHGRSVPLRVVNGDQPAALFAFGAVSADTVLVNLGTGAFLQRLATAVPGTHDRLLSSVVRVVAGQVTRVIEGCVNGAGSALAWFQEEHGGRGGTRELTRWLAQDSDAGSEPPLFLNGIAGLASPYWVADFETRFAGEEGTVEQKAIAVVESIVFLIHANLEVMNAGLDPVQRLSVSGGLSRFDGLCQRLADLCRIPVERTETHEATARGVAWLLSGGADWEQPVGKRFEPRDQPRISDRYGRWRDAMAKEVGGLPAD